MMMSGRELSRLNCFSMDSPPLIPIDFRLVNDDSVRQTRRVCMLNSRVGLRMTAPADLFRSAPLFSSPPPPLEASNRSSTGIRNAAVFPEPVRAMTTVSLPLNTTGNDLRWTGVGIRKPILTMPRYTGSERPRDWKPPPLIPLFFLEGPPPPPEEGLPPKDDMGCIVWAIQQLVQCQASKRMSESRRAAQQKKINSWTPNFETPNCETPPTRSRNLHFLSH